MGIFKVSETIRQTHTLDGAVLLDVRHGQIFRLNIVGSKILELLAQGRDETQIAAEISKSYEVNREIVRADVIEFIETLYKHNVLQHYGLNDIP